MPLLARMYVRAKDIAKLPAQYRVEFQDKLQQGGELVKWASQCCKRLGKTLWVVTDGGYTKRRFIKPLLAAGGPLAGSVGQIVGTGPGRGIGLLFLLMGITKMAVTVAGYAQPRIRLVEDELPDAIVRAGEIR